MKKSHGGVFYKSKIYMLIVLCMSLGMTGCSVHEVMEQSGDELFEQMEKEIVWETRTLSLEEIESKDVSGQVSSNDGVCSNDVTDYVCSVSMGDCLLYKGGTAFAKKKLTESDRFITLVTRQKLKT